MIKGKHKVKKIVFVTVILLLSVAIVLTSFFFIFKKHPQITAHVDLVTTIDLEDAKKQLLECQTYYTEELALLLQEYQHPDVVTQLSSDDQKLMQHLQQQKEKNVLQIQTQIQLLHQIKINDNEQINKFKADLTVINQQYHDIKTRMDQFNDQNYFLIDSARQKMRQQCEDDYDYLVQQIALQRSYFQQDSWYNSLCKKAVSLYQDGWVDHTVAAWHSVKKSVMKINSLCEWKTYSQLWLKLLSVTASDKRSELQSLAKDVELFKNKANQFITAHQQLWFTVKLSTLAQELSLQHLIARLHQIINDRQQYQANLIASWTQELKALVPTIPDEHIDLLTIGSERTAIITEINEFSNLKTAHNYEQLVQWQQKFFSLKEQINDFRVKYDQALKQKRKEEIQAQKDLLIYVQKDSQIISYFAANNFDFSVPYDHQTEYLHDLKTSFAVALESFQRFYKNSDIEKICPQNEESDGMKYYQSFLFSMNYFNYVDDCQIFSDLKKLNLKKINFDLAHLSAIKKNILQLKKFYYLDYYRQKFKTSIFNKLQSINADNYCFYYFIFIKYFGFLISFLHNFFSNNFSIWLYALPFNFLWQNYFFHHFELCSDFFSYNNGFLLVLEIISEAYLPLLLGIISLKINLDYEEMYKKKYTKVLVAVVLNLFLLLNNFIIIINFIILNSYPFKLFKFFAYFPIKFIKILYFITKYPFKFITYLPIKFITYFPKFSSASFLYLIIYYFYWNHWNQPKKSTYLQAAFDQLLSEAAKSDQLTATDLAQLKASRNSAEIEQIADFFIFQHKVENEK